MGVLKLIEMFGAGEEENKQHVSNWRRRPCFTVMESFGRNLWPQKDDFTATQPSQSVFVVKAARLTRKWNDDPGVRSSSVPPPVFSEPIHLLLFDVRCLGKRKRFPDSLKSE